MNPKLIEKGLIGNETIKGSRRFEVAKSLRSPNSHTNFSLARNHLDNKAVSVLESGENDNGLESRSKSEMKTKLCSRGHWRPTEDAKLKELVAHFGPQNWNLISHHLLGRSGKSCRLRWFNQLDPRIIKRPFTEEEESRLLTAHRAYGNKWALISRLFPGRTDNAVKNHWHIVMARRSRESQRQRHQQPLHAPVNRVVEGTLVNEENDDDGSAVSTCTTELSLTPPSSTHQPRFLHDYNTLASGSDKDGQCVKRAEVNDNYSKKTDHQSHDTIAVSERNVEKKMKSGFYFFDFLGVGGS